MADQSVLLHSRVSVDPILLGCSLPHHRTRVPPTTFAQGLMSCVVGAGTSHLLVEARQLVAEWEERCMYAQQQLELLVTEVMEAKEEARKAVSAQVPMKSAPTTLPAQHIRARQ